MSELGEFLERFYGPASTFRSVRARVRHVQTSAPQGGTRRRERPLGRPRTDLPPKIECEDELLIWGCPPDRVRLEATRTKEGRTGTTLEVVNGEARWKRHANGTVERGATRTDRHSLPTEFQRHFGRGLLRECLAALTLEPVGRCEVAGTSCLKVRAIKIPGAQLWPHWFAWEAADFELAVHVERATLLSIVGLVDGKPVESHEVLDVSYDEEIDPALFSYEPSPNEVVQAAIPVAEHTTWEAAAERAPFVLLRPTFIPEGQKGLDEIMYHPARPSSPEEHVTIFYRGDRPDHSLWITQRAERDRRQYEKFEWEPLNIDGRIFEISDPGTEDGLRVLIFEQDGTNVDITSDLPASELLRIAGSMVQALHQ